MSCIAQVLQTPVSVDVIAPSSGCCCNDIVTPVVDPVLVSMKQINVTILRGTVLCSSDSDSPVEGTIVVATDTAGNNYVGITNSAGEYSICVPVPQIGLVEYEIQAYCCCSCNGTLCTDAPCNCGCTEEDDE